MACGCRVVRSTTVYKPWLTVQEFRGIDFGRVHIVEVFGKTQQLLGMVRCKRNEYETIMRVTLGYGGQGRLRRAMKGLVLLEGEGISVQVEV